MQASSDTEPQGQEPNTAIGEEDARPILGASLKTEFLDDPLADSGVPRNVGSSCDGGPASTEKESGTVKVEEASGSADKGTDVKVEEQSDDDEDALQQHVVTTKVQKYVPGWVTNHKAWFRHPCCRIIVVWLILVQDFYLFGEDPVNDSHVECNLPGMGHMLNFMLFWTVDAGVAIFRILLIISSLIIGMYVGRQFLHHRLLRDRFKLSMFGYRKSSSGEIERGCDGSWGAMGATFVFFLFVALGFHNMALLVIGDDANVVSGATGLEMRMFGKLTQTCSSTADLVAIAQVCDTVVQDRTRYGEWLPSCKRCWMETWNGLFRVIATWIMFLGGMVACVVGISMTGKDPENINWNQSTVVGGLSELTRCFLLSGIIFCDLFTCFQDWDFPEFKQDLSVNANLIAGTFTSELRCDFVERCVGKLTNCCCCSFKLPTDVKQFFNFSITGQWLAYGPLLCVVCIDMFCARMQINYSPEDYGQYVHPDTDRIWTIIDQDYLMMAYDQGQLRPNATELIQYSARWNITTGEALSASTATDFELSARYLNSSLKYVMLMPGLFALLLMGVLVVGGDYARRKVERMSHLPTDAVEGIFDVVRNISSTGLLYECKEPSVQDVEQGKDKQALPTTIIIAPGEPDSVACTTSPGRTVDEPSEQRIGAQVEEHPLAMPDAHEPVVIRPEVVQ